ncbi:MAG: YfhO family protein [Coriobacteriales bacterium]|nr:YfhO family protein [Coriobacteriales bacterium]
MEGENRIAVPTASARRLAWGRELGWVLACLCVPIAMLCAVCAWSGVYPFGPESFLDDDLLYQYIDFFGWFRRVLTGDGSLFYSFSQTLGTGTWSQYSYYLGSPLNLLVVLFDPARLTDAVVLICAAKLSLMQLSWGVFLRRRLSLGRLDSFVLALSLAWCAWVATNLMNPLWLDMMYLLPLVMLGCHALIDRGRMGLLVAATTCSIVFCWYMGYMTCLFAVCYVLFEAYLAHVGDRGASARFLLRRAGLFALAMVVSLALSAWTFLPTILGMMGSGKAWPLDPLRLRCNGLDLLASFFVGTFRTEETPQVFVATLPLVLFVLFLLDGRVSVRMRLAVVALLLVGCASVVFAAVEFVWCGFRVPNAFYSRTAFLIPVALVWGAGFELKNLRRHGANVRKVAAVGLVLVAFVVACYVCHKFAHAINAAASLAAIVVVCLVVCVLGRATTDTARALGRVLVAALALVTCFELVRSAHVQWTQLYVGVLQQQQDTYIEESIAQYDAMQALDDGAWRADKTYTRALSAALNEGLARGYYALSSYTSTTDMRSVDLLCALGYCKPGEFSLRYGGSIQPSDSLLGVKFVSSAGGFALLEQTDIPPTTDGGMVFANDRALGLGYGVSRDVLDAELPQGNPFEAQNAFVSAMLGRELRLYQPLVASQEEQGETVRQWEVTIPANVLGCAYVTGDRMPDQVMVEIEGPDGGNAFVQGSRFNYHVLELGPVKVREDRRTVRLSSTFKSKWEIDDEEVANYLNSVENEADLSLDPSAACLFYGLDARELDQALDELRAHEFVPQTFEDGHVAGTYEAPQDGWLLLTFPTDPGWDVRVNGSKVEPQDAFGGACTAIPMRAGTNAIEMTFVPRGFVLGCGISVVALLSTGAFALWRKHRAA